jgi:hypothetical protein
MSHALAFGGVSLWLGHCAKAVPVMGTRNTAAIARAAPRFTTFAVNRAYSLGQFFLKGVGIWEIV